MTCDAILLNTHVVHIYVLQSRHNKILMLCHDSEDLKQLFDKLIATFCLSTAPNPLVIKENVSFFEELEIELPFIITIDSDPDRPSVLTSSHILKYFAIEWKSLFASIKAFPSVYPSVLFPCLQPTSRNFLKYFVIDSKSLFQSIRPSARPSNLLSCCQPTGRIFWNIFMTFGTPTCFGPRKNALENDLDPTNFATTSHTMFYFEKSLNE